MKSNIVVDTGIIIEYLKSGKGVLPTVYEKYTMIISTASYSEILASKTFEDPSLLKEVIEFSDKYFKVKDVDIKIALTSARLIREFDLSLATAYIAATSIETGFPLLTDDERTFTRVKGLELLKI